jgi:hypothetical protein
MGQTHHASAMIRPARRYRFETGGEGTLSVQQFRDCKLGSRS